VIEKEFVNQMVRAMKLDSPKEAGTKHSIMSAT
jgi:hypothetical protein